MEEKVDEIDESIILAADFLNSKWKLLLLKYLLIRPYSLDELESLLFYCNKKVLKDNLDEMAKDNLIKCIKVEKPEPLLHYMITGKGDSMKNIVNEFINWGKNYQKVILIAGDYQF